MAEEKTNDQVITDNNADEKGNITSPEGVLMLCVAGIIDIISFIPLINIISNILGIIIIGGWLVITRPGEALKKATKRFLIACGIEIFPIVSIIPSWTWFVYKTLNDG
jgi:hypothetical protein